MNQIPLVLVGTSDPLLSRILYKTDVDHSEQELTGDNHIAIVELQRFDLHNEWSEGQISIKSSDSPVFWEMLFP